MFYIQKRKSANSEWHTVKDKRGKKLCFDTIPKIEPIVVKYGTKFPGYDFRVLDSKTGEFLVF